jgi:hypothetical protein
MNHGADISGIMPSTNPNHLLMDHAMNTTLLKAFVALLPAWMLFSGSMALFFRENAV